MRSGRLIRAGALLLLAAALLLASGHIRLWLRNASGGRTPNWNAGTSSGDTLESVLDKEADGEWMGSEIVTVGVQEQVRHAGSSSVHRKGRGNAVSDLTESAPLPDRKLSVAHVARIHQQARIMTMPHQAAGARSRSSAALPTDKSAREQSKRSSQKRTAWSLGVNVLTMPRSKAYLSRRLQPPQKLPPGMIQKQPGAETLKRQQPGGTGAPRPAVRQHGPLQAAAAAARRNEHASAAAAADADDAVDRDGVRRPFAAARDRPTLLPDVEPAGAWANQGRQQRRIEPAVAGSVGQFMLFVGYPRSCHSLIASQLDAHPHMVVAHEYDLLSRWSGFGAAQRTREHIFNALFNATYFQALTGLRAAVPGSAYARSRGAYSYGVPLQWQGNYRRRVDIIGDKHGGRTAKLINGVGRRRRVSADAFDEMERALGVRLVFVHVMRHPMDNIATMVLRNRRVRRVVNGTARQPEAVLDNRERLLAMSRVYAQLADAVDKVRRRYRTVDVRCEDMVADPAATLRRLCADLGIACAPDYVRSCASIVAPVRSRTRDFVKWPPDVVEELAHNISKYDFLARNYKMTL